MFKPFSFCFILHKNVLCRLEIDRLSWHDPSDSNTIFLRWMSFPVISRKNLWLQNSIQNKFQKIPKTQENYWFLKAILALKTFTPIYEIKWWLVKKNRLHCCNVLWNRQSQGYELGLNFSKFLYLSHCFTKLYCLQKSHWK